MTDQTAPNPTAARAARDLTAIREQWGDLLARIDGPRDRTWPPREYRTIDMQAATRDGAEPAIGRMPLTLREHPAPVDLDALDAALDTEREVFAMCDAVATAVQRPVRTMQIHRTDPRRGRSRMWAGPDPADRDDPARWHLPGHHSAALVQGHGIASAGSRAYGLHWAAVWLEGRALNEPAGDLFAPTPPRLLDQLATVAATCRRRIEHALDRDPRRIDLDRPCPWCGGQLTGRAVPGDPEATIVRCATGEACGAPVPVERGRRTWRAPDLPGLYAALAVEQQG